mgnify:FL=1
MAFDGLGDKLQDIFKRMKGQGKISEIVSAKPNQRREIFEEASGISKFREAI